MYCYRYWVRSTPCKKHELWSLEIHWFPRKLVMTFTCICKGIIEECSAVHFLGSKMHEEQVQHIDHNVPPHCLPTKHHVHLYGAHRKLMRYTLYSSTLLQKEPWRGKWQAKKAPVIWSQCQATGPPWVGYFIQDLHSTAFAYYYSALISMTTTTNCIVRHEE